MFSSKVYITFEINILYANVIEIRKEVVEEVIEHGIVKVNNVKMCIPEAVLKDVNSDFFS